MGPMGPRGLGPNPFSTVSPCPPGVFFPAKKASKQIKNGFVEKRIIFVENFAVLTNVDLNLMLKVCKIAT